MARKEKKKTMVCIALLLSVCLLAAGGFGLWSYITFPKEAANLLAPSEADLDALYRAKSSKKNALSDRIAVLLGEPENPKLVPNGSASQPPAPVPTVSADTEAAPALTGFSEHEWILTDYDTYQALHQDLGLQRELQIRALITLALAQNCQRVRCSVEYVDLPEGAESIKAYVEAAKGAAEGSGGYTFEFSTDWAAAALGYDIKTAAADRAAFDAFMESLESYQPMQALVVPGVGR